VNVTAEELIALTQQRLAVGETPPPGWYRDAALFQREVDVLFPGAWELASTLVTPLSEAAVHAHDTATGSILVWGDRAFVNACPHRGNELLATGTALAGSSVRCGYHGWRYRADGCRTGDETTCLAAVEVARWGDLVFTSRRPISTLAQLLGDAPTLLRQLGVDLTALGTAVVRTASYTLRCNWKVAVENALECYHCPVAHPQLRITADLETSESLERCGERIIGRFLAPIPHADGRHVVVHQAHWFFPNQSVSTWPGPCPSVVVNRWLPLGPESTRWDLTRYWLGDPDEADVDEAWAFSLSFADQDAAIVEGVQRGIRNGWAGGRYVLDGRFTEHGPATFAAAVVTALDAAP
jgi:phenylpropionate dioxygenase-like ring-hydroxylating dioxygenase large terminal subunit